MLAVIKKPTKLVIYKEFMLGFIELSGTVTCWAPRRKTNLLGVNYGYITNEENKIVRCFCQIAHQHLIIRKEMELLTRPPIRSKKGAPVMDIRRLVFMASNRLVCWHHNKYIGRWIILIIFNKGIYLISSSLKSRLPTKFEECNKHCEDQSSDQNVETSGHIAQC